MRWLTGTNPTQAKLILLDFTRGTDGVIDIVRRFPGLAELLPFDEERSPWGQLATWKQLKSDLGAGFPTVDDTVLRQAGATWKLLRAAPAEKGRMIYVAGCQPATVIGHEVVEEEFGFARRQLRFIATSEGDGTVYDLRYLEMSYLILAMSQAFLPKTVELILHLTEGFEPDPEPRAGGDGRCQRRPCLCKEILCAVDPILSSKPGGRSVGSLLSGRRGGGIELLP